MGAQRHWLDLNDGDEEDFDEDDGDAEFEDVGWAPCQLVPVKCEADWIGEEDTKGLEGCRKRWKFSWKVEFSSVEEVILRWYICKRENLASREKRSLQCKWPMRELQFRPPFLNIGIGKIIALKANVCEINIECLKERALSNIELETWEEATNKDKGEERDELGDADLGNLYHNRN